MSGIQLGAGISLGAGIGLGAGISPPPPGANTVIGYSEMDPPVVPGEQLQDVTATINGSIGFTINNDTNTGIAVPAVTANNVTWLDANYTAGNIYTCTWGAGSTVASSSIQVAQVPGSWPGQFVFFIQGQTGPATYNYPFTFTV